MAVAAFGVACERRRISGCHLVPPKNNVCEPEPENYFCDVGILSQSQFSSNNPRTTARLCARYSLRGALAFHSIMESDWPRRNKSHYVTNRFLARVRRRYFSAEPSDSRKYVCVRRLRLARIFWVQ